ncbi:MAG: hypothetical protein QM831_08205 [Kofleriaceae bacterium]
MRARASLFVAVLATTAFAAPDPKPGPVDVKPLKDKFQVFEEERGGTYIVYFPGELSEARVFYSNASGKPAYEQRIVTRSADGSQGTWDIGMWAPRQSGLSPASIRRDADGKIHRTCNGDQTPERQQDSLLKVVPADRAKGLVDKLEFKERAIVRYPQLFARDDSGVYYYVDHLTAKYGNKGYRVFSGKKGAMKELPLTDTAIDTAGEVYSTKSGDVRFVKDTKGDKAFWIKGEKRIELSILDVDVNSHLIWSELGIYNFVGTPCDEL